MLTIVITMAGLGSRFKEAGYQVPKYMIEAKGKTLFEWSLRSLESFFTVESKYIFIVRKEDNATKFIEDACKKMNLSNLSIIEIDEVTDGQATTAMIASSIWEKDSELLIYNIDTYVEEGQMRYEQIEGDGFIPCFYAEGTHWSFVKLDEQGNAIEVREKNRISDHCTLGAYYFRTCGLYEELYEEYYHLDSNLENGEKYVAPLYNYLISKGGKVRISTVDYEKIHVLGTPKELEIFLKE